MSRKRVALHQGEGLSTQIGVRGPGCWLLGQGDWGVGRRRLTYGSGNSKPTEPEIAQGGKEGLVVLIETWRTGLIHFTNTYHYLWNDTSHTQYKPLQAIQIQAIIWLNKKIMFLLVKNGQMKTISYCSTNNILDLNTPCGVQVSRYFLRPSEQKSPGSWVKCPFPDPRIARDQRE